MSTFIKVIKSGPSIVVLCKGYNPDQPRVSAGSPEGGQFGEGGGGGLKDSNEKPEFSIKPPKKLYRGEFDNPWEEGRTGLGTFMLGRGLYSSPSRSFAAKYGKVREVTADEAFPRKPLVLTNVAGGSPQAFMDWALRESGLPNARRFNEQYPDPGIFVRARGYDGVVAGDEVVRYNTEEPGKKR